MSTPMPRPAKAGMQAGRGSGQRTRKPRTGTEEPGTNRRRQVRIQRRARAARAMRNRGARATGRSARGGEDADGVEAEDALLRGAAQELLAAELAAVVRAVLGV